MSILEKTKKAWNEAKNEIIEEDNEKRARDLLKKDNISLYASINPHSSKGSFSLIEDETSNIIKIDIPNQEIDGKNVWGRHFV